MARYLAATGSSAGVVAWHEFARLDWAGAGVAFDDRPAHGDDKTGLTGCFCAIAETGTTLLLSVAATPKVDRAAARDAHLRGARARAWSTRWRRPSRCCAREVGEPPRAMFFVSGPSRTADIEQTIVIGAHGPYRVHVILVPCPDNTNRLP